MTSTDFTSASEAPDFPAATKDTGTGVTSFDSLSAEGKIAAVAAGLAAAGGVAKTVYTIAKGFSDRVDKLPQSDELREELNRYADAIIAAEDALNDAVLPVSLMEKAPYLGPIVRGTPIKEIIRAAADVAEAAVPKVDAVRDVAETALPPVEILGETGSKVATALNAVGTVVTGAAVVVGGLAIHDAVQRDAEAAGEDGESSASSPIRARAFDAIDTRLQSALEPISDLETDISATLDQIEVTLSALSPTLDGLDEVAERIADGTLDLEETFRSLAPLQDALDDFTKPLDTLFSFLENPPSVPIFVPVLNPFDSRFPGYTSKIDAFPAIRRSDVDKLLNFFDSLTGPLLALLDPILRPIADAVRPLLAPLLDLIAPISEIGGELDAIKNLLAEIAPLIDVAMELIDALEVHIEALEAYELPTLTELTQPSDGETRETFFGDDTDNVVVGAGRSEKYGGPDLSGAVLSGAGGNDDLTGTAKRDMLLGGADNDRLEGQRGADVLIGGTGDDTILGGGGTDILEGGDGNDVLAGGGGNDRVTAGSGDDRAAGNGGDDSVLGGTGNDTVLGGSGDDTIAGGADSDKLKGGSGSDTFVFAPGDGDDRILDFAQGADLLDLGGLALDEVTTTVRAKSTLIEYGDTDSIVLNGVTTPLTDADFA